MHHPTRRHFLGTAALATLLAQDGIAAGPPLSRVAPNAKRVIFLFQSGGPSHLETFDHKPKLAKLHGSELPDSVRRGQRLTGMTSGQKSFHEPAPATSTKSIGTATVIAVARWAPALLVQPKSSWSR